MEGQADIAKETQNIKVVVVPELNAGSASLAMAYINPVIGLSTFLAQLILRKPLIEAATLSCWSMAVGWTPGSPRLTATPSPCRPYRPPAHRRPPRSPYEILKDRIICFKRLRQQIALF